ncbi:MAG: hypothetical protein EXX96DRAFT_561455 [Benjaminiella poitrasii]|nr:MAG: hypothetical protein EXX96DRAFT_561455 [Benjaminiella poitrasii]
MERVSLSDVTVGEILKTYKKDSELLKHILIAKAEEDKRRGAEEIKRAEEARLQSKFIDLQLDQQRRSSLFLDDNISLGLSSNNDWISTVNTAALNNTPPSPAKISSSTLSPYTLFDVPFADLNLSAPSSPEPNNGKSQQSPPCLIEKINLSDNPPPPQVKKRQEHVIQSSLSTSSFLPPPPPPPPIIKERTSCKRTLSRTRSTRKPSIKVLSKKNRSSLVAPSKEGEEAVNKHDEVKEKKKSVINIKEKEEEKTVSIAEEEKEKNKQSSSLLDHDKVMEALRAKLKRSTQQQKEQQQNKSNGREGITNMSPSGILLLDLKNPKKSFPVRPIKATSRASAIKKPNSFISAHKPKEQQQSS